jgi:ATP-dependent DNA helicase RecQ
MESWNNAKRKFHRKHSQSPNYEVVKSLVVNFQEANPKIKYRSDFDIFINESKLEDFTMQNGDVIAVSTIHKAKGKEFDNVFMVLDNYEPSSNDTRRQLYVGMTRAKENLTIHYNGTYFDGLNAENKEDNFDESEQQSPQHLVVHLNHHDVNLGYFSFIQQRLQMIKTGQSLYAGEEGLFNSEKELIVKFSKSFNSKVKRLQNRGFKVTDASVLFMLYWKDERQDGSEIRIVLPEIGLERTRSEKKKGN